MRRLRKPRSGRLTPVAPIGDRAPKNPLVRRTRSFPIDIRLARCTCFTSRNRPEQQMPPRPSFIVNIRDGLKPLGHGGFPTWVDSAIRLAGCMASPISASTTKWCHQAAAHPSRMPKSSRKSSSSSSPASRTCGSTASFIRSRPETPWRSRPARDGSGRDTAGVSWPHAYHPA